MSTEKTLGEKRVRTSFNVDKAGIVDDIKQKSAELIDIVNDLEIKPDVEVPHVQRLKSLAMTAYEEAAMWAVKAATA